MRPVKSTPLFGASGGFYMKESIGALLRFLLIVMDTVQHQCQRFYFVFSSQSQYRGFSCKMA
jgi:hypothetical protein